MIYKLCTLVAVAICASTAHGYTLAPALRAGAANRCASPLLGVQKESDLEADWALNEARAEAESDTKPRKTRKRDRIKKAAKKAASSVAAAASSVTGVKADAFGAAPAGFEWGGIF